MLTEPYQPRQEPNPYASATAPDIHVPVLPHYAIREVPGISESDSGKITPTVGVFATLPIPCGTRLIHESPMITLPQPGDQINELMEAFYALSSEQQDQIWSLNPCDTSISPLLNHIGTTIAEKIRTLNFILSKPEINRTHEDLEFLKDIDQLAKASEICRIAARWHTARHSLIDLPESEREHLDEHTPITGLFVETARLRHSCIPNCYAHFNPLTNHMAVHATQDISTGQELTLSTIAAVYYTSAMNRRVELKVKYGLACTCPACLTTSPTYAAHGESRLLANTRAVQLNYFLTHMSLLSDKSVARDLCLHNDVLTEVHIPDLHDLKDAADTIDALVQNLRDTGCGASPEIVRWYGALIDRVAPRLANEYVDEGERLGIWRGVLSRAFECVHISRLAYGEDSVEVAQAAMREGKVQGIVDRAEEHLRALEGSRVRVKKGDRKAGEEHKRMMALAKVAVLLEEAKERGEMERKEGKKGAVVGKMGKYDVIKEE